MVKGLCHVTSRAVCATDGHRFDAVLRVVSDENTEAMFFQSSKYFNARGGALLRSMILIPSLDQEEIQYAENIYRYYAQPFSFCFVCFDCFAEESAKRQTKVYLSIILLSPPPSTPPPYPPLAPLPHSTIDHPSRGGHAHNGLNLQYAYKRPCNTRVHSFPFPLRLPLARSLGRSN